jgi:hypothetical protein
MPGANPKVLWALAWPPRQTLSRRRPSVAVNGRCFPTPGGVWHPWTFVDLSQKGSVDDGFKAWKIQLTLGDLQRFFTLGHLMRGERECRSDVPMFQIDLPDA